MNFDNSPLHQALLFFALAVESRLVAQTGGGSKVTSNGQYAANTAYDTVGNTPGTIVDKEAASMAVGVGSRYCAKIAHAYHPACGQLFVAPCGGGTCAIY